jgi:predicted RNase H-like nuclease
VARQNRRSGSTVAFVGFDSAWTDNRKAPGAICAASFEDCKHARFEAPRLVCFDQAAEFIRSVRNEHCVTIVAIDQPTIVPNSTGARPVDRVAGSIVSWIGGGVQPANRGRVGMFDDAAPVWGFLRTLDSIEDPECARTAQSGLFLIEVFPALALPSMDSRFFGPVQGPRYNPSRRKTIRIEHWRRVVDSVEKEADQFGCGGLIEWCHRARAIDQPSKSDQDRLDSTLCLLVAIHWRLGPRRSSTMIGDLSSGYMVAPVSEIVRARLETAAKMRGVRVDGDMPTEKIMVEGQEVETLRELLKPRLKAVFVGLNPPPKSVTAGHYYQGRHGRLFWKRLHDYGIATCLPDGCEDLAAFKQSYGFADLVRRPTVSSKQLTRQEKAAAVDDLLTRIDRKAGDRPLIVFTYATPWKLAKCRLEKLGYRVVRMPHPYMKRELADSLMEDLKVALGVTNPPRP